jgi:restriction endonuclease
MKLHFEPDLDYQLDAITAVCDLFAGMERWQNEMTVLAPVQGALALEGATGASPVNPEIHDEAWLLANTQQVQLRNKLPPADELVSRDFTVEMETGTGKTYVYLRSLFELNQRFGMSKFIIVVPSVAIKEGVYKTLQITRQHFQSLYGVASENGKNRTVSNWHGPASRKRSFVRGFNENQIRASAGMACCFFENYSRIARLKQPSFENHENAVSRGWQLAQRRAVAGYRIS